MMSSGSYDVWRFGSKDRVEEIRFGEGNFYLVALTDEKSCNELPSSFLVLDLSSLHFLLEYLTLGLVEAKQLPWLQFRQGQQVERLAF
jgi:hypothetical protein